jgi:peptidoglycan/xylan/chitin deacetylase (PgdA/CDA1 family)
MPLIPNKREFLARRIRDLGLIRLIERAGRRRSLLILTYHRIGDPTSDPYYAPIISASVEAFEQQIRTLRETHRILNLDEVDRLVESGLDVKEPSALVTFDDGYLDNAIVALPVLIRLEVPATFFLATEFLQDPKLTWWDHLAYVINKSPVATLRLDRPEPMDVSLGSRTDAIAQVVRACLTHHVDDDPEFRTHLENRAEVRVDDHALGRTQFMTWDQARALLSAGMSIGSHTHRHCNLARLSAEGQRAEMAESKQILEAQLKIPISTLAYPYGWSGAFDASTRQAARETGYRLAFSAIEGVNRPGATDPMAVRRLGVGFTDSPVMLRARMALFESVGRSLV